MYSDLSDTGEAAPESTANPSPGWYLGVLTSVLGVLTGSMRRGICGVIIGLRPNCAQVAPVFSLDVKAVEAHETVVAGELMSSC